MKKIILKSIILSVILISKDIHAKGDYGDKCFFQFDCISNLCVDQKCTIECLFDEQCPNNDVCRIGKKKGDEEGEYVYIKFCAKPVGGGETGIYCGVGGNPKPSMCDSGICLLLSGKHRCTEFCKCPYHCPSQWNCGNVGIFKDEPSVMVKNINIQKKKKKYMMEELRVK